MNRNNIIKKIYLIIGIVVLGAMAFIWWRYSPLTDGEYTVGNDKIEWRLIVSNSILRTAYLKNKITGKILKINGKDFIMRIGNASSIGWSPENKKPGEQQNTGKACHEPGQDTHDEKGHHCVNHVHDRHVLNTVSF